MAIDLETILRRLDTRSPNLGVNTSPASGTGLTGLNPTGGGGGLPVGGGLNTGYNPSNLGLGSSAGSTRPNYSSVDDMGFDAFFAQQQDSLQRRLADARSQYDLANQQDTEGYERATRDTKQQQELDAAQLLDRLANQGILRSGIQVKAQSDLGESYQRRLADLERQRNESRTGRETQFSSFQRDTQDELALLQTERARREAENQKRLAEQQAQMDQGGAYSLPSGMTTDQFRNAPQGSELQQNWDLILRGQPQGIEPGTGAGDAYAAWDYGNQSTATKQPRGDVSGYRTLDPNPPVPLNRRIRGERYDAQGRVIW